MKHPRMIDRSPPVNRILVFLTILVMSSLALITGCSRAQTTQQPQPVAYEHQLIVAATFFPLYDFTKSILGEQGKVYSIVPAGAEPHAYEPTPSDVLKVASADAFVTMGIEFAQFEDDMKQTAGQQQKIIAAGSGISLLDAETAEEEFTKDPHIWLSPKIAVHMVTNIMNGLIAADPSHAKEYTFNGQTEIDALLRLDADFSQGLSHCKKDTILVTHNAFSYLARDYGVKTIYISGLEPDSEPKPQQLARLVQEAKDNSIHYIFYEELVDPRIAKTIAQEVGAQTLVLSPLEGTADPTATYITLMRENLKKLQMALECTS